MKPAPTGRHISNRRVALCPGGRPKIRCLSVEKQARASASAREAGGVPPPPLLHVAAVILMLMRSSLFVSAYVWDLRRLLQVELSALLIKVMKMRPPV